MAARVSAIGNVEKPLSQLVEKLRRAYGESLVAVVLYGSAVSEERHSKFSDFNVLCVLTAVTPRELNAGGEVFHWWRGLGNPSPLLLTEPEMASSAESFPVEFLDIQQQHRVLFGTDVISGLVIGRSFYRVQGGHELRAKVIRLPPPGGLRFDLLYTASPCARPPRRRERHQKKGNCGTSGRILLDRPPAIPDTSRFKGGTLRASRRGSLVSACALPGCIGESYRRRCPSA